MNALVLAEFHPHDHRRGTTILVLPDNSLVCCDQNCVELAAIMGRLVLAQHMSGPRGTASLPSPAGPDANG